MNEREDTEKFVKKIILIGWIAIALSSLFLFISGYSIGGVPAGSKTLRALLLMLARTAGMAAFGIGAFAIVNHRWTVGVLLIILSTGLPIVSLYLHGTF